MGEHTEVVLRELLGYDEEKIARLRADGAFGERKSASLRGADEANAI